jgi:hypothetical protein
VNVFVKFYRVKKWKSFEMDTETNPKATIEQLPEEVLLNIFEFLDIYSIKEAALVTKTFVILFLFTLLLFIKILLFLDGAR